MVSLAGEDMLASAHGGGGFPCNRISQNINYVRRRRKQQQQHKLYLHDYNYVVTVLQKL